jgi:hypothetical protein
MSHRRLVAATAAAATLLLAPQALPASASVQGSSAVAPARLVAKPLIQGVVVDQFGHLVDDVDVQATRADGTPQASDQTYASAREDGPQHGYFFLEVTKGTFTITLSRTGYQTVEYGPYDVARRHQRVSLGEIEIKKVLAGSRTRAELVKTSVTTQQHGAVDVTVGAAGSSKPTGEVEIREGRKVVGEGTLRGQDKGSLTIDLEKLAKGKHHLKAYYLGSQSVKASGSRTLTLSVTKAKH